MKKLHFTLLIIAAILLCFVHGAVGAEDALPAEAQKFVAKCDDDLAKARKALIVSLVKVQEKATKAGNLSAANAIKAKIDETAKLVGESGDLLTLKAAAPVKERLAGSFSYDLGNHRGVLTVRKAEASIPGFQGTITAEGDTAVVTWSNGTRWVVTAAGSDLVVTASDGTSKLIPR